MKRKIFLLLAAISLLVGCSESKRYSRFADYVTVDIGKEETGLLDGISDNGKEVLNLYRFAAIEADKISEEAFAGVHSYNIQSQALVIMHHIGKLILAEHAMIHKDAGELVTNGFMEQNGSHTAVHASRETEDNTVGAYLSAQFFYCGVYKVCRRPVLTTATDIYRKVTQQLGDNLSRLPHIPLFRL